MNYGDWLYLQTRLLWCYDGTVTTDGISMPHFSNNCAWMVRTGRIELRHDDKVFYAEPGQWMIAKPTQRIQTFAKNTKILSVGFDARWPDGKCWLDKGLSVVLDAVDCPELEELAKPMATLTEGLYEINWDLRTHSVDYKTYFQLDGHLSKWFTVLINILMEKGIEPSGKYDTDERVLRAVRLLNNLPIGEPLSQHSLAESVGVSLIHLTRLFQNYTGVTPKVYFVKRQLECAKSQLRFPNCRIKDVSYMLGFTKPANFSAWFKKHTGLSPRNFSKR